MGKNEISVSLVSQSASEVSTSLVVKQDDAEKAINALTTSKYFKEFYEIEYENVAIINITGLKVLENKTKSHIFDALDKKNIHVKALSQSYEELNLSLVIDKKNLIDAINLIHDELCEDFESIKCEDDKK
jgi:aspartokinase